MVKGRAYLLCIDVFGGTASVGFSMAAPNTIINDYDKVMACFFFLFTYYNQFLKKLLCELHTIFFLVYTGKKEMTEENLRLSSLYFESKKEKKPLELRVEIERLRNT